MGVWEGQRTRTRRLFAAFGEVTAHLSTGRGGSPPLPLSLLLYLRLVVVVVDMYYSVCGQA